VPEPISSRVSAAAPPGPPSIAMAHVITAVKGAEADLVPIRTALLSVSDKTGLLELGKALADRGVLVRRAARPDARVASAEVQPSLPRTPACPPVPSRTVCRSCSRRAAPPRRCAMRASPSRTSRSTRASRRSRTVASRRCTPRCAPRRLPPRDRIEPLADVHSVICGAPRAPRTAQLLPPPPRLTVADPRRPAGRARQREARGGHGGARHRAHRYAAGWDPAWRRVSLARSLW
jgi:hypothetical protein